MKMHKLFSKCTSIALTVCLMVSMVTVGVSAANVDNSNNVISSVSDNIEVQGTNSLGNMLASEIEAKAEETKENNGCNIFEITVEGKQATATFETTQNASLIVGIYNDASDDTNIIAGNNLIASGTVDVTSEDTEVTVDIDIEKMPQHFYLKGFLVDKESLKPICTAYNSPNYTKEMQKLFSMTTEKFEEERVLNLDSSNDNNFAVYKDEVKVIQNKVEKLENEENTYIVEVDESVSNLKVGDIFTYDEDLKNVLIFKIAEITINDNIATIKVEDTDLDLKDVFAYVKFDTTKSNEPVNYTVDDSTCSDGVILGKEANKKGAVESGVVDLGTSNVIDESFSISYENDDLKVSVKPNTESSTESSTQGSTESGTQSSTQSSTESSTQSATESSTQGSTENSTQSSTESGTDSNEEDKIEIALGIEGTIDFHLETAVKVYVSLSYSYCELKTDYTIALELKVNLSIEKELPLTTFMISPVVGISVKLTPKLIFKGSLEGNFNGKLTGSVGVSVSSSEGAKNLTTTPQFTSDKGLKLTAGAFVGFAIDCELSVIGDILSATITPVIGVDVSASIDIITASNNADSISEEMKHNCSKCLAGTISGKFSLDYEVKFLNNDILSLSGSFIEVSVKIADFYFSFTHNTFDFTTCPHISYLINVIVSDVNGYPVNSAIVNSNYKTDKYGCANIYLNNGTHSIVATKGSETTSKNITVSDEATSVVLTFNNTILPEGADKFTSLGDVIQVETGDEHSAALTKDGTLYMWGNADDGRLGEGSLTGDFATPIKINGVTGTLPEKSVVDVSLGWKHSAAVTKDGSLYMWGSNEEGQLGIGSTNVQCSSVPIKIMDNVVDVCLGKDHSAAITKDGSLYMWGNNGSGRLGNGNDKPSYKPIKIMNNVKKVELGSLHSAAITTDGSLYLWGDNQFGQIGNSHTSTSGVIEPTKIEFSKDDVNIKIKDVSLGCFHSGAVSTEGHLYMWGYNGNGELGKGTADNSSNNYAPTRVATNVEKIDLGAFHSAAITPDGDLYTWGYNSYGQLGNHTSDSSSIPRKIMSDVVAVSGGGYGFSPVSGSSSQSHASYTIALKRNGDVYSWGGNYGLQLGNSLISYTLTPNKVDIKDNTLYLSNKEKATDTAISISKGNNKTTVVSSGSTTLKTATFRGYKANSIYNFYSLKVKSIENPLASDNILYVDQVTADSEGNITVDYYPTENYAMPYEFVTSLEATDIKDTTITIPNMKYNGTVQKVTPTITYSDRTLYEGIDYEICGITHTVNAGEYIVEIHGKGEFSGSVTEKYNIERANVSGLDITHLTEVKYAGLAITPEVTVTDNGRTLQKDFDYTVEYQNNSNVGIGLVIVKGINNYTGRNISFFDILEAPTEPATEISTQPTTEQPTEKPTTNNYYVTGDIEMKLSTCGTNKVNGKIALQAGTYKIKLNNNGTLLGYGKTVTDTTGGLTFKSTFNSYMTLNATGGVYTFQVNTDTNTLVIKHDSNLPKEYLTGDINTILTPVNGRTLSIGTTYLEAGTYNFKLSIDGVSFGYNKTLNDKTTGSLSTSNKYSSNITLVATGGTYTFTLNTSTNRLTINHIPTKNEDSSNIHLSGDFDLVLNDNGGSNNVAIGTVDLKEGTYSFKLYNYGQALTVGVKITDKGTKTLYGNYNTPVTLIASGGTYKFSFNKTTNVLTVEKA